MNPVTALESDVQAKAKRKSSAPELLYRPLDFVMVRAPLLPVQSYLDLGEPERRSALLSDTKVRRALAAGSASLFDAVERFKHSGLTQRDADRMHAKLLRYLIRMSTRPTPFGLFAGVALSRWGAITDLHIRSTCSRTRTRPDMAWLMDLVVAAEAIPAVRKRLNFVANPLTVVRASRLCLPEQAPKGKKEPAAPVSVRATGVVKRALLLAHTPIAYEQLVGQLCEASPSASPEKVDRLLTELWEHSFLLTDLRPPLTTASPARYVAERLAGIPEAADALMQLEKLLNAAAAYDREQEGVEAFRGLAIHAEGDSGTSTETSVQVDMAMSVEGQLGRAVADEVAHTAELLLRLSPMPYGLSSLAAYRQAFVSRYGSDREVALLELLDPNRGLGPMAGYGHAPVGPDQAKALQRAKTLLQLACSALHERRRVVVLQDKDLAQLETWRPGRETAPVSLDLNIFVGARSEAAIDAGDFTIVVGPNLGALAAGRNLARFSDLLGPDGVAALKQAAVAEQEHAPDQLMAEFVYLPPHIRSANVVIRPAVRSHEVAVGVSLGVPPSCSIPLDELVVGIDRGRFYVRWPTAGKCVVFSSGHMLNYHQAPAAGQFLMDLAYDGKVVFSSFDWGPAEGFPYLPRVQVGRIVLRPAQWRIEKEDFDLKSLESYLRDLNRWRTVWEVPRHVHLSFGDNRLVIDLDQNPQSAELRAELQRVPDGGSIIVQEVVPALEESWLSGPEGRYYSEFIASLVLRRNRERAGEDGLAHVEREQRSSPGVIHEPATEPMPAAADSLSRRRPPGSEWLYVKLYCLRDPQDEVISDSMFTFAENAVAAGLAESWFFIRYADPEAHIRLRFHGSPQRLMAQLLPQVCDWASNLMSSELCQRFAFDTYDQEIERFGGPSGMALSEAVFFADSRSVAGLLGCLKNKVWPHDPSLLFALSIDDLLVGLGLDEGERLSWYGKQTTPGGPEVGSEYRERKAVLRSLIGQTGQFLADQPGGAEIARILARRREALTPLARSFRHLAEQRELRKSLDVLCSSFVHLHLNRMTGLDSTSEQRILSLLLRTRDGLKKSPVAH